ncbi:MAG: hypothetical protein R3C05_18905 [Pirellulaceae bacterium]
MSATRGDAWESLVRTSTSIQWNELVRLAKSDDERTLLCRRWVDAWQSGGLDQLVSMSSLAPWRPSIEQAAEKLNVDAAIDLLDRIDNESPPQQAAAAFVLASIESPQVDQLFMEMITQGRRRVVAYQALMVRDRPCNHQFLNYAQQRYDLSLALLTAQQRLQRWAGPAFQWVSETRSNDDENENLLFDLDGDRFDLVAARFASEWSGT